VVRRRLPVGTPGVWAKSECRTLLGLVARGSEMLRRRLTFRRTAPGVSSVVHAVGAVVGGAAAGVTFMVHAVDAVTGRTAVNVSLMVYEVGGMVRGAAVDASLMVHHER